MKANVIFTAIICLLSLAMGYFGVLWGIQWKNRAEAVTSRGTVDGKGQTETQASVRELAEQLQFQREENQRLSRVIEELQDRGGPDADPLPAFDGPTLESLRAQIEGIRGIRFLEDLAYHLVPRDEVREVALARVLPFWTERDLAGRRLGYAAMGFVESDIDLGARTAELRTTNISAYYDKEEPAIYLAYDLDPRDLNHRLAVASAQVEAMIDQNFKIGMLTEPSGASEEAALALEALIQGDMSLVLALLAQRETELGNFEDASNTVANQRDEPLSTAPLFLRELLMFPALAGGVFCRKLHMREQRSFKAIDRAYANPPVNTSEVFHEEKYLARIGKTAGAGSDDSLSGDVSGDSRQDSAVNDRDPVWSDVAGELRIRMLFKPTLPPKQASSAGIGWAGDRYWVYELEKREADPPVLPPASVVWTTVWDTETDSAEFFAALAAHLRKRYGLAATAGPVEGTDIDLEAGDRRIQVRHSAEKRRVTLIDGATADWMLAFRDSGLADRLGLAK